jgi:hypothetical protein
MVPMHLLEIPYAHIFLHRKPLHSSPATSAPLSPPRPSRSILRYVKAAAARGQNVPRSCPMHAPNSPRRQINFWPRLPVFPRGFVFRHRSPPPCRFFRYCRCPLSCFTATAMPHQTRGTLFRLEVSPREQVADIQKSTWPNYVNQRW